MPCVCRNWGKVEPTEVIIVDDEDSAAAIDELAQAVVEEACTTQ